MRERRWRLDTGWFVAAMRRGPDRWPGRCTPAAVILPLGLDVPGLDDSKKLTAKKRESLFPFIQEQALACAVAWVDAAEIDATDILSARMRAMQLGHRGTACPP